MIPETQCFLVSLSVWFILFATPLVPHMVERFTGEEISSHEMLSAWFYLHGMKKLGWLTLCTGCQVVWTAVLCTLLIFGSGCALGRTDFSSLLLFPLVLPLVAAAVKLIKP